MFITPAFAQAAGAAATTSMLMSLLPFALIFVIMYFLILKPQQVLVHQAVVQTPQAVVVQLVLVHDKLTDVSPIEGRVRRPAAKEARLRCGERLRVVVGSTVVHS